MATKKTGALMPTNLVWDNYWNSDDNWLSETAYNYESSTSSGSTAYLNYYPFSNYINSKSKIVGYKIYCKGKSYGSSSASKTRVSFKLVTGLSQYSNTHTVITDTQVLFEGAHTSVQEYTFECTDTANAGVVWMNNNLSKVIDGKDFGIRVYGVYCNIYYAKIELYYTDGGTVLYDTEFDYWKWKDKGVTSSRGAISNITDTGFTMKANADDAYTDESHVFKLVEGQQYTIRYTKSGASSNECFVFYHSSESAGWSSFTNSTATEFNFTVPSGYPWCSIRVDVNNNGESITFNNFIIVKASESWRLDTISSYTGRHNTDSWSFPSASRMGYTLNGWKDKNGTTYTSSSTYPSEDIVLYSQWTIQTRTIATGVTPAGSGSVTGGGTYNYGTQVTLTAIPASGYQFLQWSDGQTVNPRTVYATVDKTLNAVFEALSQIYIGTTRVSAAYVGAAKASAVYIGTTKVL